MLLRTRVIAAVAAGLIAAVLLFQRERELERKAFGGARVEVLVAKANIKSGGRLKEADVEKMEVPELYLHPQAISARDAGQVLGRPLALELKQGQPLQWTDFGTSDRDRAGSAVPKGLRGVAVPVNELIAKAGLLNAGDRVDVLGTFGTQGELRMSITATLLQNVPLIEVAGATAMLAVDLEQAELLTFSASHGALTVLLRNAEDLDVRKDIPPKNFRTLVEQIREMEALAPPGGTSGGGGKPNPSAILRSVEALGNQAPGRPKSR